MKKKSLEKLLALLLAVTMCFSMLPVSAFAEDGADGEPAPEVQEAYIPEPEPMEEPAPHEHDYVPTVTEPSCEAGGYTTWTCSCGDFYVTDETGALGHTAESVEAVAPTCTEPGHEAGTVCAVCGEILNGCTEIPAAGHTPEAVEAVASTCTEHGHEAGTVCAVCGEILTGCGELPLAEHTPENVAEVPAEPDKPGTAAGVVCAVCGEILEGCWEIEPLDPSRQGSNLQSTKSVVASGKCGSFMSWSLDSDGVLTISGSGQMNNFDSSPWDSYADQITRAVIENGVINIGNAAFQNNHNLRSIAISNSVREIGNWAFEWCSALESITFSSNVTYIGFQSFAGCDALETVSMPSTTRGMTIRAQAFAGCTKLKNINIPNGVTEIDTQTFRGCAMESIVIPSSVSVIGQDAFWACNNLKSITFNHSSNAQLTINSHAFRLDYTWPPVPTNIYVPNAESINPAIQNYAWTNNDYRNVTFIGADIEEDPIPSPIIVIPGIMGSKLYDTDGVNIWPTTVGGLSNLSMDNYLTVPGDAYGLFLEGNEPHNDWDYEYGSLNIYKALVDYLMEAFPDRDIFFFSYDWRQKNETSAACLFRALEDREITKANFICHSMGGLVLSHFVSLGFEDYIDRALILGTPYEGATRMIEAMLTYRALAGDWGYIANPIAWAEGLSPALKRTLPGLGELMPTQDFNRANTITVRKQAPSMNSANIMDVYGYVPGWVVNLSTLRQWLASPTLFASKEEKERVDDYLSFQEAWMGKNRLADIKVYRYDDHVQLRAVFEEDIPYENVLMNMVQDPIEVERAQTRAKKGYLKLLNMPNVFFGVGETRNTMTGLTLVWDENYERAKLVDVIEAAGDGTVPLFSAKMAGRITDRVRYFDPDHNGLVKEVGSDAQIRNWINYVFLKSSSTSNTGRTAPSPSAMTSSCKVIIHCPVYAYVSCNGETLTNDPDAFCDETSFGRMYTLGEGADESKFFILDGDVDCDIEMRGTDEGSMEFEIRRCDGDDNVIEARLAENIPLTASTVITTDTDMADNTVLSVDADDNGSVDEEIVVAPVRGLTEPLRFDQSYIAVKEGDRFSLNLTVTPSQLSRNVEWAAVDDENVLLGENPVITINEVTHEIAACRAGTAYAVAYVACGDQVYYARCRVDVVETVSKPDPETGETETHFADEQLTGVRLLDPKATVELYKTDYTRITVIPELKQNSTTNAAAPTILTPDENPALGTGVAVESARLAEVKPDAKYAKAEDVFLLSVVDDRTLEIIPEKTFITADAATLKTLRGSYKATLYVTVDGTEFEAGTLTLTVKKTLPKLSAKAVKLNSFLTEDTQLLTISGASIDKVEENPDVVSADWVTLSKDGRSLYYSGDPEAKASGKLNLLVTPTGWAVRIPVAVSVSSAPTKPKLTLKPASVSLQPVGADFATAAVTITPAEFADCEIKMVSITGGKEDPEAELSVETDNNPLLVTTTSATPIDGKAYTYKVTLGVVYNNKTAATAVLTVKLLAKKTATLSLKATGGIDLAVDNSPVTIVPTLKNVGKDAAFKINEILDAEGIDVLGDAEEALFDISGLVLTATDALKELVPVGKQARFTVSVTASYTGGKPLTASVPVTVKHSAKAPAASVTLKASGSIDVIRPASSVTLTPTVKNLYGWTLSGTDLQVVRTYNGTTKTACSESVDALFDVTVIDGKYVVTAKPGAVSSLDKFAVTGTVAGMELAKPVAFTVKMGTVKLTQSTKAVTLVKTDKYSTGTVVITTADATLSDIDWTKTKEFFDTQNVGKPFEFRHLGNGECVIGYTDSKLPATPKAGTVKIPVFFTGNQTAKPNATVSVSVKLA